MSLLRHRIGRWLLIAGLRVMPKGRARSELFALMDQWTTKVRDELRRHREVV